MQKVSGQGTVFAEFDGHVVEYELNAGQEIVRRYWTYWLQWMLHAR